MKLIRCRACGDVISLRYHKEPRRTCVCGASGGFYLDRKYAVIWGRAVAIGFDTGAFRTAIEHQPDVDGNVWRFDAFVIAKECYSVQVCETQEDAEKRLESYIKERE